MDNGFHKEIPREGSISIASKDAGPNDESLDKIAPTIALTGVPSGGKTFVARFSDFYKLIQYFKVTRNIHRGLRRRP